MFKKAKGTEETEKGRRDSAENREKTGVKMIKKQESAIFRKKGNKKTSVFLLFSFFGKKREVFDR